MSEITSVEELTALPLGQWIIDADDKSWCLFDTNVMVRQLMWRDQRGRFFVNHESITLPAALAEASVDCNHAKLNREGWQCDRCGHLVNQPPPPPEPVKPEPGRAWFWSDVFGEWCGMSPDFDNIVSMAEDALSRPHDEAARDRLSFEVAALARVFHDESLDEDDVALGLELMIRHLVGLRAGVSS